MSYEGRKQVWCIDGHFAELDCNDADPMKCAVCYGKIALINGVDDTNGEAVGYIEPVEIRPAGIEGPPIYEIPSMESMLALQGLA